MQSKIIALLSASLLLMGCADENLTPKRQEKALTQNDVTRIDDADKVAYVKALNTFTLDLSKHILHADENAVVSGFGIYTVMDMLYHGTDGKARDEFVKYMHFSEAPENKRPPAPPCGISFASTDSTKKLA